MSWVSFFFKAIMISPSLTGSLFSVTFKALFPLLLVMGGCAPEMCLYGRRLEFELNTLRWIIKHLCCVLLCFSALPTASQSRCLIRAQRLRSGLLSDLTDDIATLILLYHHLMPLFPHVMLGCDLQVFQQNSTGAFQTPLFTFHYPELDGL